MAPRILNDPVRWRFSALSQMSAPSILENEGDRVVGVSRTTGRPRAQAFSISAKLMGLGTIPPSVRLIPLACTVGWPLRQGTDTIWTRSQPGVVS